MNAIGDVLAGMVQKSLQNQEPDDYFDDEGFLRCGNCHERKQMDVTLPAVPSIGRDAKTIPRRLSVQMRPGKSRRREG